MLSMLQLFAVLPEDSHTDFIIFMATRNESLVVFQLRLGYSST